jgi:uncharacterized membrane protein YhaH (DUF805 family)
MVVGALAATSAVSARVRSRRAGLAAGDAGRAAFLLVGVVVLVIIILVVVVPVGRFVARGGHGVIVPEIVVVVLVVLIVVALVVSEGFEDTGFSQGGGAVLGRKRANFWLFFTFGGIVVIVGR